MDSFELNKIMGALLFACLCLLSLNIAANAIFTPPKMEKPGYVIEVPEKGAAGTQVAAVEPAQPIEQLLANADVKRGEAAAKKCQTCHTFAKGGEWTAEDLNKFLQSPKGFVPNTSMGFAGVSKASERADIIAFLNSLADSPKPLPKAQ